MERSCFRRPRPLIFSLCAMAFLCLVLLVLYVLVEKENEMLQESRNELFLSLAMSEAEAAESAWQEKRPTAELYHHVTAAADYLSMTTQTSETREMTKRLRSLGNWLLNREEPETVEVPQKSIAYPWDALPPISRDEGKKTAETITQTKNCLHAAAGRGYVYTCQNVYVRLSQHGGIPVEIAVYTPPRDDRPYTEADCVRRSSRFLENVLPRKMSCRDAAWIRQMETGYRIGYPCRTGVVWVDVRHDTGRIVGLRFLSDAATVPDTTAVPEPDANGSGYAPLEGLLIGAVE